MNNGKKSNQKCRKHTEKLFQNKNEMDCEKMIKEEQ